MMMRSHFTALLLVTTVLSGCATLPGESSPGPVSDRLAVFSAQAASGLPSGWAPLQFNRSKKPTHYQLVAEHGKTVLHAQADSAASALVHAVQIEPSQQPWLSWHWKVTRLIESADNTHWGAEDSPVRIVLAFDGDKDGLPFADQIVFETAKIFTGREMPYATLMYIWENKAPVGSVIANTRTGRVKMLVAASGAEGVGQWQHFSRNIIDDYQHAFGEKPGRLIGVGVLTDTDNTGEAVEAWYGDIHLQKQRRLALK